MDFSLPATKEQVEATMEAVKARGIDAQLVTTKGEALARLQALIPAGATVSTGASLTLKEIGFENLLISGSHPWKNLKAAIVAEKDPARQTMLRRQSVLADYFLGSAHAVARTGELVFASMTGSQLAPYAYAATNVIWVVGVQKLVPTLAEAIQRAREYVLPHEDARMRAGSGGKMGSLVGKMLIFEREVPFLNRKLTLLLVGEKVGD
jgi:L-lactate utilization protein LutB